MEVAQYHCSFPQRLPQSCYATHIKGSFVAEASSSPPRVGQTQAAERAGCRAADHPSPPVRVCKVLLWIGCARTKSRHDVIAKESQRCEKAASQV